LLCKSFGKIAFGKSLGIKSRAFTVPLNISFSLILPD
jgi:hypothetical protein